MNLKEMSNEELLKYDYNEIDYPEIFAELLSRLEKGGKSIERWRSPEDAVKYYEGIAKIIRKEFIK